MALARDENGWPLPPNGALIKWLQAITIPLLVAAVISAITLIVGLDRRVLTIENTRWRMADQVEWRDQHDLTLQSIRLEMAQMRGDLAGKVDRDDAPPQDYRQEVDRRFQEIRDRLRRLEGGE